MATADYIGAADQELAQIASLLIDEHNQTARAELVRKLVNISKAAVTDNMKAKEQPDHQRGGKPNLPEHFEGFGLSTTSGSLYTLAAEVDRLDLIDHLAARISQLDAMLTMVCGQGADSFHQWSDDVQDNYLWACNSISTECKVIVHML